MRQIRRYRPKEATHQVSGLLIVWFAQEGMYKKHFSGFIPYDLEFTQRSINQA